MSWVLPAATGGLNLMQGVMNSRAARKEAGRVAYQATLQGGMERLQVQHNAREDARLRVQELTTILGAQQAAFGARGVAGGRTADLHQTLATTAAMREQSAADIQTHFTMTASQYRQAGQIQAAKASARQASRDGFFQALGGAAQASMGINKWNQQRQAISPASIGSSVGGNI